MAKLRNEGAHSYRYIYAEYPGWVEQDAEDWWEAFKKGCRQVVSHSSLEKPDRYRVYPSTVYLCAQLIHDLCPCAERFYGAICVAPKANMARQTVGVQKIFERTAIRRAVDSAAMLWLKNNEPQLYEQIYKIVLVQDYLLYKLTGNLVMAEEIPAQPARLTLPIEHQWAMDIISALGDPRRHLD